MNSNDMYGSLGYKHKSNKKYIQCKLIYIETICIMVLRIYTGSKSIKYHRAVSQGQSPKSMCLIRWFLSLPPN